MNQNNISLEKVVKELARIREDHFGGMTSYEGEVLDEALALLKAQEPVKPMQTNGHTGSPIWICGKCKSWIGSKIVSYCWYCGRPVKWE